MSWISIIQHSDFKRKKKENRTLKEFVKEED